MNWHGSSVFSHEWRLKPCSRTGLLEPLCFNSGHRCCIRHCQHRWYWCWKSSPKLPNCLWTLHLLSPEWILENTFYLSHQHPWKSRAGCIRSVSVGCMSATGMGAERWVSGANCDRWTLWPRLLRGVPSTLRARGFDGSMKPNRITKANHKKELLHMLLMLPESCTGQRELWTLLLIPLLLNIWNAEPLSFFSSTSQTPVK